MTAKEFVLQEYPKAYAYHRGDCWIIYDDGILPKGWGLTASSAWTNAKQNIKEQDTSINPDE